MKNKLSKRRKKAKDRGKKKVISEKKKKHETKDVYQVSCFRNMKWEKQIS